MSKTQDTEPFSEKASPKRIQRKRTKGWRMPENAVYVGRPSKWGNPIKVTMLRLKWMERECAVRAYEGWLSLKLKEDPHFLDALKGKDLACWCPLDKTCHADVLLKFLGASE
jgi:hypothetical protein